MPELVKVNHITRFELDTIARINATKIKMHIPTAPVAFLELDVHDPNGEHVYEFKSMSKSFVRNWYNCLLSEMCQLPANTGGVTFGVGTLPLKQVPGSVLQSLNISTIASVTSTSGFQPGGVVNAGSGSNTYGIVVGTGNTAESFEDFALEAKVVSGTTTGQLSYAGEPAAGFVYDSGTKKWTITIVRTFNNNSDGTITVKETGIECKVWANGGSTSSECLLSRDVLAIPIDLVVGSQLTVTYVIDLTFPY